MKMSYGDVGGVDWIQLAHVRDRNETSGSIICLKFSKSVSNY
jgi:hypothetical protein